MLGALKSTSANECASAWIQKTNDKLNLCKPFPDIFKELILHRILYFARNKQPENATVDLLEFYNGKYSAEVQEQTLNVLAVK